MHNKRPEALGSYPGGDWVPGDFEMTAPRYAAKLRKTSGAHVVFTHFSVPDCAAIALKNKIRAAHLKAFVAMIDRMDELES